ncbi:hypothetical protein [Arthrobacter cavernae]|uniref:Uncharacterized protein n=1 Tax=Arthrobacter cavernae TaxID=2817681 RepID=A0A939KKW2_9MICC|nr:hypothetical protein [Arthrobacter cavernae]MBO1269294.1 hypothetical protein [Arthrobacter cavernae]
MTEASHPVYTTTASDGYEWVLPLDSTNHRLFRSLSGSPAENWQAPEMYLLKSDEGQQFAPAFLPWLASGLLVLRDEAIQSVGDLLKPYGELLPLRCAEADLALFNPLRAIDALNEEESTIVRFGSGKIMNIEKTVFHGDRLKGLGAFKLANYLQGKLYLSKALTMSIQETGYASGTDFKLVT